MRFRWWFMSRSLSGGEEVCRPGVLEVGELRGRSYFVILRSNNISNVLKMEDYMRCPYCGKLGTEVRWTKIPRKHPAQVHRGRRCGQCRRMFTTAEVVRSTERREGEV